MSERRCESMKDVEFLKVNKILENSYIGVDVFHVFTTSFGRLSGGLYTSCAVSQITELANRFQPLTRKTRIVGEGLPRYATCPSLTRQEQNLMRTYSSGSPSPKPMRNCVMAVFAELPNCDSVRNPVPTYIFVLSPLSTQGRCFQRSYVRATARTSSRAHGSKRFNNQVLMKAITTN